MFIQFSFVLAVLACQSEGRRGRILYHGFSAVNPTTAFHTLRRPSSRHTEEKEMRRSTGRDPGVRMSEDEVKVNVKAPPKAASPATGEGEISIAAAAQSSIDACLERLGPGEEEPKSLQPLKDAISEGDAVKMGAGLFKLLAEQSLDYDLNDEGKIVRTTIDYSNTDDEKVKERMSYIYKYGINMMMRDLISQEDLMQLVISDVASRVGMDGPAFDTWLGF
jgi:hypothetical protein